MTPAESALYLGVPNVILTRSANGQPFGRQFALSLSGLSRVIWPTDGHEHLTGVVWPLLAEFPNITGVSLDGSIPPDPAELSRIMDTIGRRELWVSIPSESLNAAGAGDESLQSASAVVLWPAKDENPERSLAGIEKLAPAADILLGCAFQDEPQSNSRLLGQWETALKWVRLNRIDGLVFAAGAGITGESDVEARLRQWIGDVGGESL